MAEHDTNDTPTFVKISNREIWEKLNSMERTVFHMDQRMNTILSENVTLHKSVRALELKVYTVLAGFTTSLTAAGAWFFTHL